MIHIDDDLLDVQTLTPKEVAEQLMNSRLERNERIGEVRLERGHFLEVDVHVKDEDVRMDGHLDRTETFDIGDIRNEFEAAEYYCWATDGDGNDVLACFGC